MHEKNSTQPGSKRRNVWKYITIACLTVGCITGCVMIRNMNQKFNAAMSEKYKTYENLAASYNELVQNVTDSETGSADVKVTLKNSKSQGDAISDVLNKRMTDRIAGNSSSSELVSEFRKYMPDTSFMMNSVYMTSDTNILKDLSWKYLNSFSFDGQYQDVVWVCMHQNKPVAFLLAKYDSLTNTFVDMKQIITDAGIQYIVPTNGESVHNKPEENDISGILAMLDSAHLSDEDKQAYEDWLNDEDAQAADQARREAMEEMRNQQMKEQEVNP